MATPAVIQSAADMGANLIITHEPTFYSHTDSREWLEGDEVYQRKQALIEAHQMNIWRFHDHIHMMKPDGIYAGYERELGWENFSMPEAKHIYTIPPTTVPRLAAFLKERLNIETVRIVGKQDARVERVGVLVGGGSLGLGSEIMPMQEMRDHNLDVIVCGEILEWTLCAYVRDAGQLGMNKALIIAGHNRTEEVGMKYLPDWLRPILPNIPACFIEAGDPFTYQSN